MSKPISSAGWGQREFAFMKSVCFYAMPQIGFQHHGAGEYVRIIKASCYNKPPVIFSAFTQSSHSHKVH